MIVTSRIGQSLLAAVAAVVLAATSVGAAVGPVSSGRVSGVVTPAALVVAQVSSQA